MLTQKQPVLGPAAAGENGLNGKARLVHFVDDMPRPVGDRLDRRQVKQRQIVERRRQLQSRHHSPQGGVRPRRPVAVEVRKNMKLGGQPRGHVQTVRQMIDAFVEELVYRLTLPLRLVFDFAHRGM